MLRAISLRPRVAGAGVARADATTAADAATVAIATTFAIAATVAISAVVVAAAATVAAVAALAPGWCRAAGSVLLPTRQRQGRPPARGKHGRGWRVGDVNHCRAERGGEIWRGERRR